MSPSTMSGRRAGRTTPPVSHGNVVLRIAPDDSLAEESPDHAANSAEQATDETAHEAADLADGA